MLAHRRRGFRLVASREIARALGLSRGPGRLRHANHRSHRPMTRFRHLGGTCRRRSHGRREYTHHRRKRSVSRVLPWAPVASILYEVNLLADMYSREPKAASVAATFPIGITLRTHFWISRRDRIRSLSRGTRRPENAVRLYAPRAYDLRPCDPTSDRPGQAEGFPRACRGVDRENPSRDN